MPSPAMPPIAPTLFLKHWHPQRAFGGLLQNLISAAKAGGHSTEPRPLPCAQAPPTSSNGHRILLWWDVLAACLPADTPRSFFSPSLRHFYAARCVFNRVSPFPPTQLRHILVRIDFFRLHIVATSSSELICYPSAPTCNPPPFIPRPGPSRRHSLVPPRKQYFPCLLHLQR